jgi:hypothetical protein
MSIIVGIKEEYARLVPKLPPYEYEGPKYGGLHLPKIENQYGILVDGQHRPSLTEEQ